MTLPSLLLAGLFAMQLGNANAGALPKPTKSQFLETRIAAFVLNFKQRTVAYTLKLTVFDTLPRPAYLQVSFENPVDKSSPDIQLLTIQPGQAEVDLESTPFSNARNGHSYRVSVAVFSDAEHTTRIGEHLQDVKFVAPHK